MTPKQEAFVREYLVDLNATQAAIRAGYNPNTAKEQASRLLTNVNVAAAVADAKAKRASELGVDARWVLKRLSLEAEADLADLYAENGSLRPIHEWPLIWRQGLISGVETVREGKGDEEASFVDKIKISDRIKRIELIGKHVDVEAFRERIEVDLSEDAAKLLKEARGTSHAA